MPSIVHQKLKLLWKGGVLAILGDGEISVPVCDIKGSNDIQLRDFEVMKSSGVVIASIMKKMGYKPGMGLGKFNQGIKKLLEVCTQNDKCKYGLEYKKKMGLKLRNKYTLNENFVKLGENFPYCGFPEPKESGPGFETFFKTQLTLEDKAQTEDEADKDWMEHMDAKTMKIFRKYQVCPNLTSVARSTENGKNDENKPKCWKIANNGYPAYHLCAQNLPNPYHEFPKS